MTDFFGKYGSQWVFRDTTDFNPTAANDLRLGSPTAVQLDLTSLANQAARQSDKFDLDSSWGLALVLQAALEFQATPTSGASVFFYMAWSESATAGTANPGGVSGSDGAYSGYSSNLNASLAHLDPLGAMPVTVQTAGTVQVGPKLLVIPKARYGTLVVVNESGAALHTDAVEAHVTLTELLTTGV